MKTLTLILVLLFSTPVFALESVIQLNMAELFFKPPFEDNLSDTFQGSISYHWQRNTESRRFYVLEGSLYSFEEPRKDEDHKASAIGLTFGIEQFMYDTDHDGMNPYFGLGFGFLHADDYFPKSGTKFNFTEYAKIGLTKRFEEDLFTFGLKYTHVSNGSFVDPDRKNPALDYLSLYAGYGIRF